jgi:hypothetical protein
MKMLNLLLVGLSLILGGCSVIGGKDAAFPTWEEYQKKFSKVAANDDFRTRKTVPYVILDRGETSVLRAEEDGTNTILQLADMTSSPPLFFDGEGNEISYVIDRSYAVIEGVRSRIIVKQNKGLSMVTHPSLPISSPRYPVIKTTSRLAIKEIDVGLKESPLVSAVGVGGARLSAKGKRDLMDESYVVRGNQNGYLLPPMRDRVFYVKSEDAVISAPKVKLSIREIPSANVNQDIGAGEVKGKTENDGEDAVHNKRVAIKTSRPRIIIKPLDD